jgi:hypothetical protein
MMLWTYRDREVVAGIVVGLVCGYMGHLLKCHIHQPELTTSRKMVWTAGGYIPIDVPCDEQSPDHSLPEKGVPDDDYCGCDTTGSPGFTGLECPCKTVPHPNSQERLVELYGEPVFDGCPDPGSHSGYQSAARDRRSRYDPETTSVADEQTTGSQDEKAVPGHVSTAGTDVLSPVTGKPVAPQVGERYMDLSTGFVYSWTGDHWVMLPVPYADRVHIRSQPAPMPMVDLSQSCLCIPRCGKPVCVDCHCS